MSEATKQCCKCQQIKPLTAFRRRGGDRPEQQVQSHCKGCGKLIHREWRADNPERNRVHDQARHLRDPRKRRARNDTHNAMRKGEIVRPAACSDCSIPCVPEAHHPDYDRPDLIDWLCRRCHMALHRRAQIQ